MAGVKEFKTGDRVTFEGRVGTVRRDSDTGWVTAPVEFDDEKSVIVQVDKNDLEYAEEYWTDINRRTRVRKPIKTGDRVQVIAEGNPWHLRQGIVGGPWKYDTRAIMVDLYGHGEQAFYAHQLEVMVRADDIDEIERKIDVGLIVQALVEEGGYPNAEAALEVAEGLYRAGARIRK